MQRDISLIKFWKYFFPSWLDLNVSLDAVFNADYEFDIYFVKELYFGIENWV
jgi:hypothetical protein